MRIGKVLEESAQLAEAGGAVSDIARPVGARAFVLQAVLVEGVERWRAHGPLDADVVGMPVQESAGGIHPRRYGLGVVVREEEIFAAALGRARIAGGCGPGSAAPDHTQRELALEIRHRYGRLAPVIDDHDLEA